MSFQTPITLRKVLDRIASHEYVLPAIQREFVWRADQIARLFDSLMRGYPIGSFLFWEVRRENTRQFKFYDFVRNYHARPSTTWSTSSTGRAMALPSTRTSC